MNILEKNIGVIVMGFSKLKIAFALLGILSLIGCSGGEPLVSPTATDDTTTDTTGPKSVSGRNVTFLPLSILETSSEYSGFDEDNFYATEVDYPFISKDLLTVFDSKTLLPVQGTVDDFVIIENDKALDSRESFPILQSIGAIPTYLHTGIVLDVSGSVESTIGFDAIVSETKAMITAMKASADPVIANQRFSIWIFAREVKEITSGFTSDTTVLNAALDSILTLDIRDASNLNGAIVEAIGNYNGSGGAGSEGDFKFRDEGGQNNDLKEEVSTDRIQLSSLILVTSGSDSLLIFDDDQVKTAIESQSQVIFDKTPKVTTPVTDTTPTADTAAESKTKNFGKPFIVVLVGNDLTTSKVITDNASNIIDLKGITGSLAYAQLVTDFQTTLINQRKRESDRNVLRYASPLRQGSHTGKVTTSAVDFKYSLTQQIDFKSVQTVGMPSEVYIPLSITSVEITGENNQYLQNVININNTSTFLPATRWTSTQFAVSDYTWALDGVTLAADASTGAVTISPASITVSATLSLTNNAISETKNIELTAGTSPGLFINDQQNSQPLAGRSIARTTLTYVDLNAVDPDAEVDPDAPAVVSDEVYSVIFKDYNAPFESYTYLLSLPGWTVFDATAPDTTPFDFKIIGNRIQIKKASIDSLNAPIIITINNTTLGTTANFTITL